MKKFQEQFPTSEPSDDFLHIFETAMINAGFDFETDSEEFIVSYIQPTMEELKTMFRANDEAALAIYRSAGLDDAQIHSL